MLTPNRPTKANCDRFGFVRMTFGSDGSDNSDVLSFKSPFIWRLISLRPVMFSSPISRLLMADGLRNLLKGLTLTYPKQGDS